MTRELGVEVTTGLTPRKRTKLRMLWLENDEAIRDIVDLVGEEDGWRSRLDIQWVTNGDDAAALLAQELPDIFATDIHHDGLRGVALVMSLLERRVSIPILIFTGCCAEAMGRGFFDSHALDAEPRQLHLLLKPCSTAGVSIAVEHVCRLAEKASE